MMKVKLDNGAFIPTRAHEEDAGLDIKTPEAFTIRGCNIMDGAGKAVIRTGVHVEIPKGYVGFLKAKSGLNVKHNIYGEGVIDASYTGEIVVKLYNNGDAPYHFNVGDKIIQLVILPIITPEIEIVDELEDTERGDNGFGSTGK